MPLCGEKFQQMGKDHWLTNLCEHDKKPKNKWLDDTGIMDKVSE
jgi:hypothetical protein